MVGDLRTEGNDLAEVEVKLAAGGFPQSAISTLSAFANTPGGGVLILGLEEDCGAFTSRGVYDPVACQAALASTARSALEPPVVLETSALQFEDSTVVVATVQEAHPSLKPCRVKSTRKAYLRAYDGDYQLSDLEEQALIANRTTPRFDAEPVSTATASDLDPELVADYVDSCRSTSHRLSTMADDEVLFRTGVLVTGERVPSVAGLLALGTYPQQHFPGFVLQASIPPSPDDPPGTRSADSPRFDGPIPAMLDQALRWVSRNTRKRVRFSADGHGRDEPEFPPIAVRELLSNALVHRDLGPHAFNEAATLRLEPDQLILSNPGGLYGLTVDRLGTTGVTSARNAYLVGICRNVRYAGSARVVEALASGIPTVLRELRSAGMAPPRFHDQAIRFTVRVPSHTLLAADDLTWLSGLRSMHLSDTQRHVLVNMRHGATYTNKALREAFPMDSREARSVLGGLVEEGVAEAVGERGGRLYRLADSLRPGGADPSAAAAHAADQSRPAPVDGEPPNRTPPQVSGSTPRYRGAREDNAGALLDILTASPGMTAHELEEAAGLSHRQVTHALRLLRSRSQIHVEGGQGKRGTRYHSADQQD
ncbi:putative DNA binding domain-containing protein [Kineococcus sp. TRM81007]|uniref:ATP-binding protein n=1 Tax=Kineococcus sp. TRM81007 TaxID=2925831 RepID=UPI001F594EB5|nr:ATP-binding protein [Kineococcus sp. TRM81007]MCI2237368.1 putative DNA binding domain-containing protein [Kineococcus sp. TRM81007]